MSTVDLKHGNWRKKYIKSDYLLSLKCLSKGFNPLLESVKGVGSGVLEVFEAVVHEFYAAKPTGDADDAVGDVLFLHDSQNDHSRSCLTVV